MLKNMKISILKPLKCLQTFMLLYFLVQLNNAEGLKQTIESVKILREVGMNLRKLMTDSQELRRKWLEDNIISLNSDIPCTCTSLKVLRLIWNNNEDALGLELGAFLSSINIVYTKRKVLKIVAKLFNPSGFILHPF